MYQGSNVRRGPFPVATGRESPVSIIGAGIAGAWQAVLFAQAGHEVTLHERSDAAMTQSTSYWAGGMLAPYCEAEASEPVISRLGIRSLDLWREHFPQTPFNGSLVVAHPRDRADFERFARLTTCYRRLDAHAVTELEPSLEGRFHNGLFYADEGHVEPRRVLPELHARFTAAGGTIQFDSEANPEDLDGIVIDCRGLSARDAQPALRGVKGEIILIESDEVELSRPVRLIHPRWPLYVIPRRAGAVGRRLCGASGLRRGPYRRIRLRAAPGLSRQSAAHRDRQPAHRGQRTLPPRFFAGAGAGRTDTRLRQAR